MSQLLGILHTQTELSFFVASDSCAVHGEHQEAADMLAQTGQGGLAVCKEGVVQMGFLQGSKPAIAENFGLDISPAQKLVPKGQIDCRLYALKEEVEDESATEVGESTSLQNKIFILYDQFRPRLLRYLGSLHLNRDQAEEIVQEAFLRLATELAHGKDIENLQGWILRVAHNQAIDLWKRREREMTLTADVSEAEIREHLVDSGTGPYEKYQQEERMKLIEDALLTLNSQQRQCFHMRVQGFRYKDIANALGISEQRAAIVLKQVAVRLAVVCK